MVKGNKNAKTYGMIIGLLIGAGVGIALKDVLLGIALGVPYGLLIGKILAGEELVEDKKTRRTLSWSLLALSILGCLLFGYLAGDIMMGLTAGIGFSFVIGLKWEKLYDERMSSMFSKAARNAFVIVNFGFSIVLMEQGTEILRVSIPLVEQLKYVIYLSWAIFVISWLYHANYKGE
jgi:hypothetical protein